MQLNQINNTSKVEINSFKRFIQTRSKQLLRLVKECKNLLDEHGMNYDRKIKEHIHSIYLDMDFLIRHIEQKAKHQLSNKIITRKTLQLDAFNSLLENLKSMHDRSFLMYVSLITLLAESILLPSAAYPSISVIILCCAALMSLLYLLYEWLPDLCSSLGFGILVSVLLFLHLQMSSRNGMAHVIQMAEMMLSIYLIFRFGWKYALWVGISFICFSIICMALIRSGKWDPVMRFDPDPVSLVGFFAIAASSFILLARFSVTRNDIMQHQLDILHQQTQQKRYDLSKTYKEHKQKLDQINSISTSNSHELRAPIARMMGIMDIINDPTIDTSSRQEFESFISNSLNEAESVVDELSAIAH
jgi:hypothetical protein